MQHERELSEAIARLAQLREELKAAIDADAESYNAVMKAYKRRRIRAGADGIIDAALKQATSVPLGRGGAGEGSGGDRGEVEADYESEYEVGSDHGDWPWRGRRSRARWPMWRSIWNR